MSGGRYDAQCEALHLEIGGRATMLLVIDQEASGFSVTTSDPTILHVLPAMLRDIANDIEAQNRKRTS